MSTLQVANLHFESTGNNRIQLATTGTVAIVAAGSNTFVANSTSVNISVGGTNVITANSTVATITGGIVANGSVGTSGQVLVSGGAGANAYWGAGIPEGSVIPYAGSAAPSGWLLCYGQAVSRTTYAALFAAISTTYGTGDGSTTFNLPDLRGRVIAGQDDMGGVSANRLTNQSGGLDGDTLGATGGAETHTLTTAQIPAHTHTTHTHSGSGGARSDVNGDLRETSTNTGSTGGGGAHNNVQPTIILNYIIKT